VLNHEQEEMARHFAGMTGMTMDDRFGLSGWQKGALGQPVLKGALASLEGEISRCRPSVATWSIWWKSGTLP
jgi:flavin reductase (NADH)